MVAGLTLAVAGLAVWALGPQERRAVPAAASPVVAAPAPEAPTTIAPPRPNATSPDAGTVSATVQEPAPNKSPLLTATTERPAAERRAQAERERVARERQRVAQAPEPARTEQGKRPADPVVQPAPAAAPVAAQAPPPAATVDQTCAGSSNFITRDICRMRACRNPAMAGDAVCVRFREMEEANRSRQNQ